jgi:hypothetical protein
MAEDGPTPPLPRRVPAGGRLAPGGGQWPEARPVRPTVLSEDVLRRIRDALGAGRDEASPEQHPAPSGRPASLSRRVPDASHGPAPPAPPEARIAPDPRAPARQQPDRQDGTGGETGRPEQGPARQHQRRDNGQAPRGEGPARRSRRSARRAKAPARAPEPSPPKRPPRPGKPAPQTAPLFAEQPERATPRPSALIGPRRSGWGRRTNWVILVLALAAAGSLALLLAR